MITNGNHEHLELAKRGMSYRVGLLSERRAVSSFEERREALFTGRRSRFSTFRRRQVINFN